MRRFQRLNKPDSKFNMFLTGQDESHYPVLRVKSVNTFGAEYGDVSLSLDKREMDWLIRHLTKIRELINEGSEP